MSKTIPLPSLERQIRELRAYISEAESTGKYPWKLQRKLDKWREQFNPNYGYGGNRHALLDDATLDAWIARQKKQWPIHARALLDGLQGLYMERLRAKSPTQSALI